MEEAVKITPAQREFLYSPLNKARIANRNVQGRQLSYLEASDVKRYLIRVFGIGGFNVELTSCEVAFEQEKPNSKGTGNNWNVGYRATVRLTIRSSDGFDSAAYEEAAVGFASLPDRGEAHDMAMKTAESDALKRCAIYLGTQFGLSLYFDGTLQDVVGGSLDEDSVALSAPQSVPEVQATPEVPTPENVSEEPATVQDEAKEEEEPAQTLGTPTPEAEAVAVLEEAGAMGTVVEPHTPEYVEWMTKLRDQAVVANSALRIAQVIKLKGEATETFGSDFLDRLVTIKGSTMTYRRLCDDVATGAFLPKPEGESA
jgi:hypothetical protein